MTYIACFIATGNFLVFYYENVKYIQKQNVQWTPHTIIQMFFYFIQIFFYCLLHLGFVLKQEEPWVEQKLFPWFSMDSARTKKGEKREKDVPWGLDTWWRGWALSILGLPAISTQCLRAQTGTSGILFTNGYFHSPTWGTRAPGGSSIWQTCGAW